MSHPFDAVIEDIPANCGNCTYWIKDERHTDIGNCLKSPGCYCCRREQLFGGIGGGHFQSHRSFLCKFWSTTREYIECIICDGKGKYIDISGEWKCPTCDGSGKVIKLG